MSGMADGDLAGGIWNWCAAEQLDEALVRSALSAVLDRPVTGMIDDDHHSSVLCDVYHVGGDFPTVIDIYLTPAGDEYDIASAVAVRLGAAVLLPDDSLNPTRYVLNEPDGTRRPVHADESETDEGTRHGNVRPCTGGDPACAVASERRAA